MKTVVNYVVGDVYNNRVVTKLVVSRQMNPRRANRLGRYIEWQDLKTKSIGKCNFSMFGQNHPRSKPISGVNDIATVAPWLASWLKDPLIAQTHMVTSKHLVDWVCPTCGSEITNKTIVNCYRYKKVNCPYCSGGVSYPERFIANLLRSINIPFDFQREFSWSDNRIYDFYIPSLNLIIETHGKQHYTNTWSTKADKMQKLTIQEVDAYKQALAKQYGITHYIILDCQQSDCEYIHQSINRSKLAVLLNLNSVDWNLISLKSLDSTFLKAINMLKLNIEASSLFKELPISAYTLNRYVKRAKKLGLLAPDFKCPVPWNSPLGKVK